MTGTIPKNAGSTSKTGSQKARALCREPGRRFHFSGTSGSPVVSHGCQGRSQEFPKFVQDRTQTRRKLKVQGGLFARFPGNLFSPLRPGTALRNGRSWRVLAGANRRDCLVRIPNCFCRSFHLSRNDRIAKGIVARNAFCSDDYSF